MSCVRTGTRTESHPGADDPRQHEVGEEERVGGAPGVGVRERGHRPGLLEAEDGLDVGDLRVDDVAVAVRRTEEIGGVTVKAPGFYPPGNAPYLEWAIMQDPFGNQFCFVKWPLASPAAVEKEESVTAAQ